jgi:hypothetical protein
VLQQNRMFLTAPTPIIIVGLFENDGLLEKPRFAAKIGGFEEVVPNRIQFLQESRHNRFFFTTLLQDFIRVLSVPTKDEVDVTVNVVYESSNAKFPIEELNSLPPMELFRLNIIRMHDVNNGKMGIG